MSEIDIYITPAVRADLDRSAAAAGYEIKSIGNYILLLPSESVSDPLGQRGYFGFHARTMIDGGPRVVSCLWRFDRDGEIEEGERFRFMDVDASAGLELGEPKTMKGWLPQPSRVLLEGGGHLWRLFYDVSRETVS